MLNQSKRKLERREKEIQKRWEKPHFTEIDSGKHKMKWKKDDMTSTGERRGEGNVTPSWERGSGKEQQMHTEDTFGDGAQEATWVS